MVTPSHRDVGPSLVVHEPKTLVDLSKAMDNHTYKFDAGAIQGFAIVWAAGAADGMSDEIEARS